MDNNNKYLFDIDTLSEQEIKQEAQTGTDYSLGGAGGSSINLGNGLVFCRSWVG